MTSGLLTWQVRSSQAETPSVIKLKNSHAFLHQEHPTIYICLIILLVSPLENPQNQNKTTSTSPSHWPTVIKLDLWIFTIEMSQIYYNLSGETISDWILCMQPQSLVCLLSVKLTHTIWFYNTLTPSTWIQWLSSTVSRSIRMGTLNPSMLPIATGSS